MTVTPEAVIERLQRVLGPDGAPLLPISGRLSSIIIRESRVAFSIFVTPLEAAQWEATRLAAERAVAAMPGVVAVTVVLTADSPAPAATPQRPTVATFPSLARVRHVIAVASGKGGVGKSTTACNIALALTLLERDGRKLRVGVLDADIYGPSMPKLFGLRGTPRIISGKTLEPLEAYGCKVMSIGFLVDATKAMVWRGPMVASAVTQLLRDVVWSDLDVLVVDMPPGTGDAQLSLAQQSPLAGAVIVSTPQDLALIDARRGVAMFKDVGVPILGLIENMSYFICDDCGKRHHIFAHGGARAESATLGVPFLGEIPLDLAIRERSDAGLPIVVTDPDSAPARAYSAIAAQVWERLEG